MKSFYILSLAFGLISSAHAQDANPESIPDAEKIQKAIEEFNRSRKEKPNEVTVVLPPPDEPVAPRAIAVEEEAKPEDSETKKPVLVSGKPPETTEDETPEPEELKPEEPRPEEPTPEEIVIEKTPAAPAVRVESIRAGTGKIDPKNIQIKSSFPTKALAEPPNGWKLETTDKASPFSRQVEIKPGIFIALEINPHILSPVADGEKTFAVTEPGYDPLKGYQQDHTVANILESSITQLDQDALKMGNALSELHRLLASLPKPETPVSNTPPSKNP
ncbi:MAG: hypothetical protein V4727_06700 [Verrucomicrobiota bacterium]